MSEVTVDTIARSNAEIYDRLLVSIEAGIGLLQIFIAICDADRQRKQIITNYERELAPNIQHYSVTLDRQEPSLRHAVASLVTTKNAVVTVLGTETLGLLGQNDESLDKFFGYLQWTREALREFQIPIVLWIPSRILEELAKRSPDFWSWRNGVFQFQIEQAAKITDFREFLFDDLNEDELVNLDLSAEQLETSLAKAISTWGVDSRNTIALHKQLGNLYTQQIRSGKSVDREREFTLAKDHLNRAIQLETKFQQEENLTVSLNNLAELYRSMDKYTEAEPLYRRLVAVREQQLGENHPDTVTSLNNLAELYQSMGRYTEAEPLLVRSLAIREELLGENPLDTATSLNNLAELYRAMGRYTEAEPLLVRSIAIREELLGENHPDTATSLNNLAELYRLMGRYTEAAPLYMRSSIPLEKMTLRQLRRIASELGISRSSRMHTTRLLEEIKNIKSQLEARLALEAGKFKFGVDVDLPAAELINVYERLGDLSEGYGKSRIVLLPRDSKWAYAYWDIPTKHKNELRSQGGKQLTLRIYDITNINLDHRSPYSIQEYPIDEMAREWYLPIPVSDREYVVDIGYRCADGRWLVLARSKPVNVPPIYASDWCG